jgi:hypothetical protein
MIEILINLFIVIFLVFAWCWNLPHTYLAWRAVQPLNKLIRNLGLDHNWSMFAPNPLHLNFAIEAEIHHFGGEIEAWQGDRLDRLAFRERIFSIRDRKWNEYLCMSQFNSVMLGHCRYLANLHRRADGTLPEWVILFRCSQKINLSWAPFPNPSKEDTERIGRFVACTYEVEKDELVTKTAT